MNRFVQYSILICYLIVTGSAQGQPPGPLYPKGYFRNPLSIPISLSGNFGELRPNHYHMGLDLKTNARENLPVYAAAEGYIARIKIEPGGFGRAIYINHPNGLTTLYAHLNAFAPNIESYLKKKQYELESWNVMLELPEDLIRVKKGEFIANSGNTGGSMGPHLHFEIRRTEDDVNLNPFLFGFPISDKVKPRLVRLGIYDRTKSVYHQSPKLIALKAIAAGKYSLAQGIIKTNSPLVSFGVTAYDTHSGSSNLNGIYSAALKLDGSSVAGFRMDEISYNDTRYLNAHIDYRLKHGGGPYLQHLSELPGYINSIYWKESGNGVIDISDGQVHEIEIEVEDAYGNNSTLFFKVQYNGEESKAPVSEDRTFYPMMVGVFESEECEFYIGEQSLYDSVRIPYRKSAATSPSAVSSVHHIGYPYIPLQSAALIRILPTRELSPGQKDRVVMQWFAGNKMSVQKVTWNMDWAYASFRDLGAYQLLVDEEKPVIVPVGFADGADFSKSSRIVFTVKDNLEKFKNVRAEIDGKWVRFTNDKGRNFIYYFDENCPRGSHELYIKAEDEAGNIAERTFRFKR